MSNQDRRERLPNRLMEYMNFLRVQLKSRQPAISHPIYVLFHKYLPILLIFMVGCMTGKEMYGRPIICLADGKSSAYIEAHCFNYGTYTAISRDGTYDISPGIRTLHPDSQIHNHRMYKFYWLIPLVQAMILVVPKFMWIWLEGGLMRRIMETLENEDDTPDFSFVISLLFTQPRACLIYFALYIFCHWLQVVALITCFYGENNFLFHGNFMWYGMEFLMGDHSASEILFPLRAKCQVRTYGTSGNVQVTDAICEMNLNDLNRVLFFIQWWGLVLSMFVAVSFAPVELMTSALPFTRVKAMTWMLKIDPITEIYLTRLGVGRCFLLRQIERSCNIVTFDKLLKEIIQRSSITMCCSGNTLEGPNLYDVGQIRF